MKLPTYVLSCLLTTTAPLSLYAACAPENQQYENLQNGAIMDKTHNLMWMQCTLGTQRMGESCIGKETMLDWNTAMFRVGSVNSITKPAGFSDWQLPTKVELQTLVASDCYDPTIHETFFPGTLPSGYWSSTEYPNYKEGAYLVFFLDGGTYLSNKQSEWYIRLVRRP